MTWAARPDRRAWACPVLAAVAGLTACALVGCGSRQASTGPPATSGPTSAEPSSPARVPATVRTRVRRPGRRHLSMRVEPWHLPRAVGREAAVGGPRGVVVAGGLVGDQSSPSSYRLELGTGRVTGMPNLPVAVHDAAGAVDRGRPEVLGGGNATEQDVVQRLGPGGAWTIARRLPTPRSDLVSATVGGRVFVIGGYDATTPAVPDILVSDRGRRWMVFGRLQVPVRYAAAAVADGAIWVFGGERSGAMVDAVQRVDLRTGRVRVVARLPRPVGHAAAVALGSRILVVGGRATDGAVTAATWWFTPSVGSFRRAARLPYPLADTAVVTAVGAAYLLGGETPQLSDKVLRLTLH